jgi:hypothetical protein
VEIAKTITPPECMRLSEIVEGTWGQAFGIVRVQRLRKNVAIEIELEDDTRHHITLTKESEN